MTPFTLEEPDIPTILIVNHNPATLFTRLFSRQGYRVLQASTGTEALMLATVELPAVVILDGTLPDLDGAEFFRQLTTQPETKFLKVIQISAVRIDALDRARELDFAADAYLIEPVEEEALISIVRALFKLAQHERDRQRLTDKLTSTQHQLLEATKAGRFGIWDWNITTGTLEWFGAHEELAGMRPGGFSGKIRTFTDILHPEDRARVWHKLQDLMTRQKADYADDYRFIHPDGSVHWMSGTGRLYYDEQGQAIRMTGVVQDISERKQAEEQLQQRNRQLELLALSSQRLLLGAESEQDLLEPIFMDIARLIEMEMFYHYRPSEVPRMLRLHTSGGITEKERTQFATMGFGELLCGRVAEWRERVIVEDLQHSFHPGSDVLKAAGATSYAGFPLVANGELVGTIAFISNGRRHLRDGDVQMIQTICDQIATALERTKLQRELRESEERLLAIFDRAPAAIFIKDRDGRSLFMNDECARVLNLDRSQVRGKTEYELYPPALADRFRQNDRRVWESGDVLTLEEQVEQVDGLHTYVSQKFLLRDEKRQPYALCGIADDITPRLRMETALRESELRFRTLVERIGDVFWIYDPEQGKLVYASQAYEHIWGRDLQQLHDRFEIWLEAIHDEDRERVRHEFFTNIQLGQYDSEYRVVRPDGTIRWIRDHGKPLGIGKLVAGVAEDITERKRTEDALRESEERYRATVANAAVGIGRVAFPNATWIDVNEALCRLVGYSREEMLRIPWPDITYPDDLDLDLVPFRLMAAGGLDTYTVEKRFIHKEGHCVWARLTLSLVRDAEGHPLYEICIAEDIKERKWAEQILMDTQERLERWNQELEQAIHEKTAELQQSQARLRSLASQLTLTEQRERKRFATELHDHLQQMLVVGKLAVGQGKRRVMGMPECEAVFKKVDEILSEALIYSRTLVAELSPPVLREHGLAASLQWLADSLKHKHGLTVMVRVPEGTPIILSENRSQLIFQSVRELLINSAKHAGTGEATVTLEDPQGHLSITVSDRGQGFDLAAAAGTVGGGISSKFGLFSVQERMRALGGTLDIHSAPGQGTIAKLTLPFGDAAADDTREGTGLKSDLSVSEDSVLSPPSSALSQDAKIHVLLVDDHTLIRQGLRAMLDGYEEMELVGEAANGEEAVRLVEELHPAVVVMDINMPKMDGIEATRRITSRHPHIAVIGLSVNAGVENQEAMSRAGAVRLMTKESAMEDLYGVIHEAVKGRRLSRE
ncbi:MAG: PAS domain S-box protein [Nitrospira sp.]